MNASPSLRSFVCVALSVLGWLFILYAVGGIFVTLAAVRAGVPSPTDAPATGFEMLGRSFVMELGIARTLVGLFLGLSAMWKSEMLRATDDLQRVSLYRTP